MALINVVLVGAPRYSWKSELYEEGKVYALSEEKADYLLQQFDPITGQPFFEQSSVVKATASATKMADLKDENPVAARRTSTRASRKTAAERPAVVRNDSEIDTDEAVVSV